MGKKQKKKKAKNKKNRGENKEDQRIIDIEDRREARRRQLREEAERSRARRGRKSITQEMMEEIDRAEEPESPPKGRAGKKQKKSRPKPVALKIIVGVLIVVGIALAFSLGNIIHLKIEQAHAENELAALQKQQEELQEEADRIGTGEYMEQQARDWLKMAKQGEIIYEFDGDNDDSAGSSGSGIKDSGDEEKENQ